MNKEDKEWDRLIVIIAIVVVCVWAALFVDIVSKKRAQVCQYEYQCNPYEFDDLDDYR